MPEPLPTMSELQVRAMSELEQQQNADSDWALENYRELALRYPGEYLIVWKKQVLAHGLNPLELLRDTTSPEHPCEELVVVDFPDPFIELPFEHSEKS